MGVLSTLVVSAPRAFRRSLARHDSVAVRAVVDGHAMSQPQLAADVPIAKAVQPVQVRTLIPLGVPAPLARFGSGNRLVAHLVHAQPPLVADQRLDYRRATIAMSELVRVRLFFH